MTHILVIEDDLKLNKLFSTVLQKNHYQVSSAYNGSEALSILETKHIDLIVSDIMMPEMYGYQFTRLVREARQMVPILIITAKDSFDDMQAIFQAGSDDYMIKPINVNEMLLRIQALLRRSKISNERKIKFPHTILDSDSLTVTMNNNEMLLPQKEFQLLFKLVSYPNKIFTRQQLMDELWGLDSDTDERTVDVHINRLRERLKNCLDFKIVTVRGLGYKVVKRI